MRKGLRSKRSNQLTITAVALQDHIARNLQLQNLSLQDPMKGRCASIQRNQKPSADKCGGVSAMKAEAKHHLPQTYGLEEEYVLEPRPPSLTLAQKLGLVNAPPAPLTTEQWTQIKSRSIQEGDSHQPCTICREDFQLHPQACLKAFERFSGRKCCPMCRKEQYETRVIHDAAHLYREKCAVRIQACWRGHLVRKWYRHIRKMVPPKDQRLRRKFFEVKLQEITDRLVQSCDMNIDEFLDTIDHSVALSRRVCHQFEEHISVPKEDDWEKIQLTAWQRGPQDCPICFAVMWPGNGARPRQVLLLSCSHLYHQRCLEAFEELCCKGRPVCPLCRSPYHKRVMCPSCPGPSS